MRRFNYKKHSQYYFPIPPDVCVAVCYTFQYHLKNNFPQFDVVANLQQIYLTVVLRKTAH